MQHYALLKFILLDSVGVSVSTTRLLLYLLPNKYRHKNSCLMSSDFLSQNDFNAAKIGKNPHICKYFAEKPLLFIRNPDCLHIFRGMEEKRSPDSCK